jgi:glycine cleavage system H lipoate-binding protein
VRDAYYRLAKACHPDQGGSAAEFRALAAAYERALNGDDVDAPNATPEHGFAADDPLAVYVRVERERAAAMRRELAEAAKLNSGGLDKGGMWWLAEQMAGEQGPPEEVSKPPPKLPRRQNARPSRKMSTDAKPAVFRANDSVWAAMRPGDTTIRLGVTAEEVEELGLTEDRAFVDLAQLDSFTLPGRPFAMVEGPNGTVQLESPIAGVVAARNETLIENPGRLARNAECVDDAWLVELDVDDDAELVRAELAALEDFPERPPK